MKQHFIAWWNLENLFDVENSALRPEWLAKKLAGELKGWTKEVIDKKLTNLSKVISKMNNGTGPDILGVCEVENENVLQLLTKKLKRKYKVAHKDTKDQRGIDIAFLYDSEKYSQVGKLFSYEVIKRAATRDIVQIEMKIKGTNKTFILLGNHWPSRSAGQYESEPFRIIAAETLSYWLERIPVKTNPAIPIIVMGDFNDEPHDRSLREYALSLKNKSKVSSKRNTKPYLYNAMWEIAGQRQGTFFFENEPNVLDQFLFHRNTLLTDSSLTYVDGSTRIEIFDDLKMRTLKGTPIKFSRPSENGFNEDGFSDHFPISCLMEEK